MSDEELPPPALRARVIASLREQGLLRSRHAWLRLPLAIAAGLALFLAGTQVRVAPGVSSGELPGWVLLLYEDEAFRPAQSSAELVREYTAWGVEADRAGEVVLAEELAPDAEVLGRPGPPGRDALGRLTGMYVVRAPNAAAAVALARGHPHLRHGGSIVVRGFVRHG
jgi:hypothetical protein